MKASPAAAGAVAAVVVGAEGAAAGSEEAEAVVDSAAARLPAGFPVAAGLRPDRVVAAADVWRAAAVEGAWPVEAASTAGRRSALLVEGEATSVLASGHRSVREARDLGSDSCRQPAWEAGRGLALASPTESGLVLAPASVRGSVPGSVLASARA
ncbi:MAG: hypothetical protein ACM3U2_09195 [Deltaproteobacteria bacterium]